MDGSAEPPDTGPDPELLEEEQDPVARAFHGAADSYGVALALLVLVLVLPAFLPNETWAHVLLAAVAASAVMVALLSSRIPRWLLWIVLVLAVAVPVFAVFRALDQRTFTAIESAVLALVMFVTLGAILNRIARHRRITVRTLYGAIAVYLLLGIAFSFVYQAFEQIDEQAIQGTAIQDRNGYSYYSFVTLTTVGYGDIVPVSKPARTAAIFEMLTGQVFLVVIVARVVSMLGRERAVDPAATLRMRDAIRTEKPPIVGED